MNIYMAAYYYWRLKIILIMALLLNLTRPIFHHIAYNGGDEHMSAHGLRGKIYIAYGILIILVFGVSLNFIINLSRLSETLNGLINANYKSIEAAQSMIDSLDQSQTSVLTYIVGNKDQGIHQFSESNRLFTESFLKAKGNITEKGESDTIDAIKQAYDKYYALFIQLQGYENSHNTDETIKYYNDVLSKQYLQVKSNCKDLLKLNENAMFNMKNKAIERTRVSIFTNLIISIIVILLGFALTAYVLSSIFKPIYQLTSFVKSIKEGNLSQRLDIDTNDEIGQLANEFNSLTKRLEQYEQINIKKLVDEKNKSVSIVSSISEPIIVTDTDYKIVLINPAAETIFDTNRSSALGRHFLEVVDNKAIFNSISKIITGDNKNDKNEDTILIRFKGRDIFYKVTVVPILVGDNVVNGSVTVLQDITRMKEIENLKSEFVSTVSHEFRTPLTSISLGVGLLLDNTLGEINDDQREIITAIRDEEVRLANLVSDLLDLSRIESGKIAINMKPASIRDIIGTTVKSLQEQAKNKGIDLGYYIDEEPPPVKADPERISTVLINLIGNALKFTPEGGKIEVFSYYRDKKVYVSVKDTGIGIPREYQEKIFEKFVQVKNNVSQGKGTGLGLAISKKIIELHGGEIWVESKDGKGSTFTFTLKPAK